MFVELHLLQNFAPSNLNRDDTGSPKDCEFGGYRRARISSQCLKRAIRTTFRDEALVPANALAVRTKRAIAEVGNRLADQGKPSDEARQVVEALLGGVGITAKDQETQYLLFLGRREIDGLAELCAAYWDQLPQSGPDDVAAALTEPSGRARRTGREAKRASADAVPAAVKGAVLAVLNGGRAVDLALFGRMIADQPGKNVDAACQVAHAISTHRVNVEFDFYTAVDDLRPAETTGAGMMGTIEFNSACFYRYANVDLAQLARNLGGDRDLARMALGAFIRAAVEAEPSGKQNSMAARNPPSLVMAVARERGLWSLANAFSKPVTVGRDGDLVGSSVAALDHYWSDLTRMYGTNGISGTWVCSTDESSLSDLGPRVSPNVDALIAAVLGAASFDPATRAAER